MLTFNAEPIACTLIYDDYRFRLSEIESLSRAFLRSARRAGLTLHLTYGPEAADRVRELVRQEQSCCAFLHFDVREEADGIHLAITAPERAREAADVLFIHFAPDLKEPA